MGLLMRPTGETPPPPPPSHTRTLAHVPLLPPSNDGTGGRGVCDLACTAGGDGGRGCAQPGRLDLQQKLALAHERADQREARQSACSREALKREMPVPWTAYTTL